MSLKKDRLHTASQKQTLPKTSLFVILARNSPLAVIVRRGPTRQVQLIKWDRTKDTFEEGQWFKGRVYERRCDLSPDGKKLIYFAATYRKPFYSWTAISTIPYFSALLLWPKGDGWGGGGLFDTPFTLSLNHRENEMELIDGCSLPKNLKVYPFGTHPGWGEDYPIYHTRLIRDGWRLIHEGTRHESQFGAQIWMVFDPPTEYRKTLQVTRKKTLFTFELSMQIKGIHEKDGDWYVIEYQLHNLQNKQILMLGRLDWADWDENGDLLFSKEGKLFRLKPNFESLHAYDKVQAVELADFSDHRFTKRAPSKEALQW